MPESESRKAYKRAYYSTPEWKERQAAYSRAFRRRNPEKIQAANKKVWAERKEEERLRNKTKHEYRKNAIGTFTKEDVLDRFDRQAGLCFYCFSQLEPGYHVDHFVPIAKGGTNTKENIVCSCPTCNLQKNAHMPEVFFARKEQELKAECVW